MIEIGVFLFVLCCVFGHDNSFAFWQDALTYDGRAYFYISKRAPGRR